MRGTVAGALALTVLGLCGCSPAAQSGPAAVPVTVSASPSATPQPAAGPLPPADALTGVMYRLADPAVPGPGKLVLVAGSSAPDAAALDRFAAALRDGGFSPVTFTATDIGWSQTRPGDAVATITVTTVNPAKPGEFTFPMEFAPTPGGGWQLTRDTAEMLFAFGNGR
jgi:hypothetical protein